MDFLLILFEGTRLSQCKNINISFLIKYDCNRLWYLIDLRSKMNHIFNFIHRTCLVYFNKNFDSILLGSTTEIKNSFIWFYQTRLQKCGNIIDLILSASVSKIWNCIKLSSWNLKIFSIRILSMIFADSAVKMWTYF